MTTKARRPCLPADFKRPLQQPFVGTCEPISWAAADLMFDASVDDGDIAIGRRDLGIFIGSADDRRD